MVVASWIAYASCKDEKGQPISIVDLRKEEIMKVVDQIQQDGGTERFMKIEGLFGVLATHDQFNQNVQKFYHSLRTKGVHESL
jgi:mannitol 2-dehydrogenase